MQVSPHVHSLKIPFVIPVSAETKVDRIVYCFLIIAGDITLVDTGVAGSEKTIFEELRKHGRKPTDIRRIVLTHAHPDHIGAANAIVQVADCEVLAHEADREWIENTPQQARERPVPGFHSLVADSIKITRAVKDGDVIPLSDGMGLNVIHTPGHSPGSICLLLKPDGVLFAGDAVPSPDGLPVYDDVQSVIQSLRRLRGLRDVKMLVSAWGDVKNGSEGVAAIDAAIDHVQHVHAVVRGVLSRRRGCDSAELCRRAVEVLALPPAAANPLVARTFEAHRKVRARADIRGK